MVSKKEIPELELPVIRGVATFQENLYDILAVLSDANQYARWMHNCREARLLETKSDFELLVYNRISTPWPLEDRDTVVRTKVDVNREKRTVFIRFKNVASSLQAELDGVTRMPLLRGFYKLEMLGPEKTRVTYQAQADPGGIIPQWLVIQESKAIPANTIRSLRKRVRKTRGTYKSFLKRWSPLQGGNGF